MVIYEVNLTINEVIFKDYYAWLQRHVKEILGFKGFRRAEIGQIDSPSAEAGRMLRVSYYVDSQEALQQYLKNHAPQMRAQAIEKFGSLFSAHRRIIYSPITITLPALDSELKSHTLD